MEKESNKHQKERINKRKFIQLNAPTSIFIAAIVGNNKKKNKKYKKRNRKEDSKGKESYS